MKKHIIITLKLLFILFSFAFIFWQADITKIYRYLNNANLLYLCIALIVMLLAQIISAGRMRYYYKQLDLQLNWKFSVGLYLTSMLFNTVLPGGIGGDGYKIYSIGKLAGFSRKKALQIAISERASGLFALLLLTALCYFYTNFPIIFPYQNYIIACFSLLLLPAYFISARILLQESIITSLGAVIYSIPIQLLNALIAFILLIELGADVENINNILIYIVIFMASSVAAILPVTIGGAGIREITFLYSAKLIGIDAELGIALAFMFFIINALCSLTGFIFWHRLEKLYHS